MYNYYKNYCKTYLYFTEGPDLLATCANKLIIVFLYALLAEIISQVCRAIAATYSGINVWC